MSMQVLPRSDPHSFSGSISMDWNTHIHVQTNCMHACVRVCVRPIGRAFVNSCVRASVRPCVRASVCVAPVRLGIHASACAHASVRPCVCVCTRM